MEGQQRREQGAYVPLHNRISPHCFLAETLAVSHTLSAEGGPFLQHRVSAFSDYLAHHSDSELTCIPRSLPNTLSKYLLTVTNRIQAHRCLPARHRAPRSGQSCDHKASFLLLISATFLSLLLFLVLSSSLTQQQLPSLNTAQFRPGMVTGCSGIHAPWSHVIPDLLGCGYHD